MKSLLSILAVCVLICWTAPSHAQCPTNRFVECGTPWSFDTPVVVDPCSGSNLIFQVVSTTTNIFHPDWFEATRTWEALGACTNLVTCSQTITNGDTLPPLLKCGLDFSVECGTPWSFDTPLAEDDWASTNVSVHLVSTLTNAGCGNTFTAVRTWSATDPAGNSATCSQAVEIVDTTPPIVVAASNVTIECGDPWSFGPVTATDSCDGTNVTVSISSTLTNLLVGGTFTATRVWLATDSCGNASTATQMVAVIDTTPPNLLYPTGVVAECAGSEGTTVSFSVAAMDVCDTNAVLVCTPPSGSSFAMGDTLVTCVAFDASGNTNQGNFVVTVVDTTPPTLTCPTNMTGVTDPGLCETTIPVGSPTASDLCGTVSVMGIRSDALALTDAYPKGLTFISWTATDAAGLTNSCVQTITVMDEEPPAISCPENGIVAESPRDSGFAPVTFAPVVTDNCPGVTTTSTPSSGSLFPVGYTTVNCVATDESGNTNACSFTIRVIPYRLTVTNLSDSGPGTFRQALLDANDGPGENRVEFNLPGPPPYRIQPVTDYPVVTSPVIIDGWTQPGFAGVPLVELDGQLGGGIDGLRFQCESNTVQGLAVVGFDTALKFEAGDGNRVNGNYIGVDSTGTNAPGNNADGLWIGTAHNTVGGSSPSAANVIAGNGGHGVHLSSTNATNNRILANLIGTTPSGRTDVGNSGAGILLDLGAANNHLGTTGAGDANRIQFNADAGIAMASTAGVGNRIGINGIDANGALGIDLGNDGVTDNDPADSDVGPNNYQNFPDLLDARSIDGITTIDGSLTSTPSQSYRLDFYLNPVSDPTGYGEGRVYLGFKSVDVDASGTAAFSVSFPITAVYTDFVTATATDPAGNTSEFSKARQVRTPPVVELVPMDTNAVSGTAVTLCADASGTPPIRYQWRLNGANIPGETNQCILLPGVEAQNAGAYSVIIFNVLGGVGTAPASLTVPISNSIPAQDFFADREPLPGLSGQSEWSNVNATRESGEPLHAGKPGGKSVWYEWTPDTKGIATIGTRGSDFDTLLAVYQLPDDYAGNPLTNLMAVISDEDRGGFFTSGLRFNVFKNRTYIIVVDGYFGESGAFVLSWDVELTSHMLPVFKNQPESRTVAPGSTAEFSALAARVCGNGGSNCPNPEDYPHGIVPGLTYQWFFEDAVLIDETNSTLVVSNVQAADVGRYYVEVTTRDFEDFINRTIRSDEVDLQINETGQGGLVPVLAKDKFPDTLLSPPWVIGGYVPTAGASAGSAEVRAAAGLTSGYTGTQVFNTSGSSSSSGETILCSGVPGGSSKWITLVSEVDGELAVNTAGSSYDTIIAVYGVDATSLAEFKACAIDGNNTNTPLRVSVDQDETFTILVDGQYGAFGTLVLNYSLIAPATLVPIEDGSGNLLVRVLGYPGMKFDIESSTNFMDWTTLISTNSEVEVFDYVDPSRPAARLKYYRARFIP